MKFACGIVTYIPKKEVIRKIEEYAKVFDGVYVYDNTPFNKSKDDFYKTLNDKEKILILKNGINDGLSHAYNCFLHLCGNNYDYICILDQDSIFRREEILRLMRYIEKVHYSNTAVIGPTVIYNHVKTKRKNISECKKYIISSGSFINLNLIANNIFFDEAYFIDRVDTDFCYSCSSKGFSILLYRGAFLEQRLGNKGCCGISQHNYIRHYYMFRNRFYFNKKFSNHYIFRSIVQTLKQCSRILLFENNKFLKLKQLRKAFIDYKNGNMGEGRY